MVSRVAGALVGLVVVAGCAGCTSGSSDSRSTPSPATSKAAKPSVPMRVEVTHVAGRLTAAKKAAVTAGVRRALASYVSGAFLGGSYPRTDFTKAFAGFTAGTRPAARRDLTMLTNRSLGASTSSVRALKRTAYVSVLAPMNQASGATAAVDLVFLVDRGDAQDRKVHVQGRLLLTRDAKGRWAVFGYDVHRSQVPAGSAS